MSTKKSTSASSSKKPVTVVELGGDWVKLIEAAPTRGGVAISKLHLERFESLGSSLSDSLSAAVKKLKLAGGPVIGCLPQQMVTVRVLELPSTDPAEIADMVDLQADKQTPYSKDEIVADYRILGAGREGYTRVMLAIVQRSILRERFAVLEGAGLDVGRMTVGTEGVLNWLAAAKGGDVGGTVLLDVDSFFTEFAVLGGDGLVTTRSILVGANHLLEDEEKATQDLLDEVSRSLETCRSENPGISPSKLLVSGAAVAGPELAKLIGGELGLAAEALNSANSVASMPSAPSLKDGEARAVSLTPLVGVALDPGSLEYDLVPDAVRLRKDLVSNAKCWTALGIAAMAALVVTSLYGTLKFFLKQHHRDCIRRELNATAADTRQVERMQEIVNVVHKRQNTRLAIVNLLEQLHPQVPGNMYFEAVEYDGENGQILLDGSGSVRSDIGVLVQNLEGTPYFESVEAGESKTGRDGRLKFQVVCRLEKQL